VEEWKKCLEQVQALELTPEATEQFVSGNAKRVFHFG
jgi:heme oxygenase